MSGDVGIGVSGLETGTSGVNGIWNRRILNVGLGNLELGEVHEVLFSELFGLSTWFGVRCASGAIATGTLP